MSLLKKCLPLILTFCIVLSFASCEFSVYLGNGNTHTTDNYTTYFPEETEKSTEPIGTDPGTEPLDTVSGDESDDEVAFADPSAEIPDSYYHKEYISGPYGRGESYYSISDGKIPDGVDAIWFEGDYPYEEYPQENIFAGQITAKAWDDNDYYEQWKELFSQATDNDPAGKFEDFNDNKWAFDTTKRVKVTVTKDGAPAVGVKVSYIYPNQLEWTSKTDANGVAYVFPGEDDGKVTVSGLEAAFSADDRELAVELYNSEEKANVIKLMFVIDATGSMGDEMQYIAAELVDVVSRVAAQAEQVRIELALLFYRDDGDQEKFAYHDFEIVSQEYGLEKQLKALKAQRATGGGDYPEAVDEAMLMAAKKDWGDENSTNLIFLVLDAPSHDTDANVLRCAEAVQVASAKGIRICPVLCSGADTLCEYITRNGALLTGGTSIFVTDDSGIGGSHLDPELPDATVECLNDLMVRLIVGYHTGTFAEPTPWQAPEQPQTPQPQITEELTDIVLRG